MSQPKLQFKEAKPLKTFKDSFTNTNYKRPFILDKFIKDLHCPNLIAKIDPLTKKRKQLRKLKIPRKIKISAKTKQEVNNNRNKTPFLHLIPNINQFDFKINQRKLNFAPKKKLTRQRSDFDLPMITKYKLKNSCPVEEEKTTMTFFDDKSISNSKDEEKNNENLITSEMMDIKELFKNESRKISVCSFMNKLPGNKSLNENYKIINDINIINDKYNLKLNLNKKKSNSTSNIFDGKKYNIYGMLNKLFHYYSSETNSSINKNNKYTSSNNYKNSSIDFDTNENKKNAKNENNYSVNNTIEIMKDTYEDDSNTFLTKIKNYNVPEKKENEFNISKLIKRRCSLSDINRNNKQVITNDRKIGIHCLLSKAQKDISLKKILYKYIDKTLYELEDDPIYKRIKEFEENIEKILKNKY